MTEEKEIYDHPLYKHCKNEKEADAIAWAFVNSKKMVRFPFKFPALGPKKFVLMFYMRVFVTVIA